MIKLWYIYQIEKDGSKQFMDYSYYETEADKKIKNFRKTNKSKKYVKESKDIDSWSTQKTDRKNLKI